MPREVQGAARGARSSGENAMIKPTVGRVVWYYDSNIGAGPFAAIVAHVWSDTCVNLAVFNANGVALSRTSVYLVQEGAEKPGDVYAERKPGDVYAEWMPYQKGQAAKTETLERQIGADLSRPRPD
jgi:hypothetical protein